MRRLLAITVAFLAGALAPLALLAWDVRQVLFDTDYWVEVTAPVLHDDQARAALSVVLVDGVVATIGCRDDVASRLAASRLGNAARARASRELEDVLASATAATAWSTLNRDAHAEFVRVTRTGVVTTDDRLLESAELLDLAAAVVTGIAIAGDDDEANDESCVDGGVEEAFDPVMLRAAAGVARGLHVAHWLPVLLASGSVALFGIALLLARSSASALGWWGLGVVAAAAAAWWGLDAGLSVLVDGIRGDAPRALAERLLDVAFDSARGHQVFLGAAGGVISGTAFAVALVSRRSDG